MSEPSQVSPATAWSLECSQAISPQEFALFQHLIHSESGVFLPESKRPMLVRRLRRRLKARGVSSFTEYYELVSGRGGEERVRMLDCVLTNETSFFREARQFDYLREEIVPRLRRLARTGSRPRSVRAWCAACSTGEEAYSLAMVLHDALPPSEHWTIEVCASDLSTRALESARRGVFPLTQATEVPQRFLKSYMLRGKGAQDGRMKIAPEIAGLVSFSRINLIAEPIPAQGPYDLILCRNVLIYFDTETKKRVIEGLLRHLASDGYLFVGHAESLATLRTRVAACVPMVYRHPASASGGTKEVGSA